MRRRWTLPTGLLVVLVTVVTTSEVLAWGPWRRAVGLTVRPNDRTVTLNASWPSAPVSLYPVRIGSTGQVTVLTGKTGFATWSDPIPHQDPSACYLVAAAEQFSQQGFSDLQCAVLGLAAGLAPLTLRLFIDDCSSSVCTGYYHVPPNHAVSLAWTAPSGAFTDYLLVRLAADGATTAAVAKGSETVTDPLDGPRCYVVVVRSDDAIVGNSDLVCAAPVPRATP